MTAGSQTSESEIKRLLRIRPSLDVPKSLDPGDKVVKVFSQEDFPPPIGGAINLEDSRHYVIANDIRVDFPFVIPNTGSVEFSSTNLVNNSITMNIGSEAMFQGINIQSLLLNNIVFIDQATIGSGTATIFDIRSLVTSINSSLQVANVGFINFKILGLIEGFDNIGLTDIQALLYQEGLIVKNFKAFFGISINWNNQLPVINTTDLTVEGSGDSFSITSCLFSESANSTALHIDVNSTIKDGRVTDCVFVEDDGLSIKVLEITGKDQTDINWNYRDNGPFVDSHVTGELFILDNTTETTIATIDTPVKIAGTSSQGKLERFTHSNGRLTYIGLEGITISINMFGRAIVNANNEGDKYSTYLFKNGVKITDSRDPQTLDQALNAPSVIFISSVAIDLITDDFIELFVENNSTTEDILFSTLRVVAHQ